MTTQREETNSLKDEYQAGYRGRAHDVRDRYIAQLQSTLAEREEANAELEAEVLRLRGVLSAIAYSRVGQVESLTQELFNREMWADQVLSTKFTPTTLNELIEKVEKMTLERCAVITAWSIIDMPTTVEISTVRKYSKAIRALPTGQIKLEELL